MADNIEFEDIELYPSVEKVLTNKSNTCTSSNAPLSTCYDPNYYI